MTNVLIKYMILAVARVNQLGHDAASKSNSPMHLVMSSTRNL